MTGLLAPQPGKHLQQPRDHELQRQCGQQQAHPVQGERRLLTILLVSASVYLALRLAPALSVR